MDCFYTVSAFRDWHSLSNADTTTISIDRSHCVWIKSTLYQDFFFLPLLRLRLQKSFHKTLWEKIHSSETTNKRLKWDKRLRRFFWQMGRVRAIIPSESMSPQSRTSCVLKALEQREVWKVMSVLLCHSHHLCHLSAPDKLSEMPPLIAKDSSNGGQLYSHRGCV